MCAGRRRFLDRPLPFGGFSEALDFEPREKGSERHDIEALVREDSKWFSLG